jgi:hypothetical protein
MKGFVRLQNGELAIARNAVYGPGYVFRIEDYAEHIGPIVDGDGWQVVANLDDYINVVPPTVGAPRQVTPLQARLALSQFGMLGAIQAFVASLPEDNATRLAWEYASDFREDSQMLIDMCTQLGISDEQKALLFDTAMGITV